MSEFDAERLVKESKESFVERLKEELERVAEGDEAEEVYFHGISHEVVDSAISGLSRQECLDVIDETGNEEYADKGILDFSSLDRLLETLAYECLYQEFFNDDLIQTLQDRLNETLTPKAARSLLLELAEA